MLHLSPYRKREKYLAEKREPNPPKFWMNNYAWHGSFDEENNMRKFSKITGIRSRSCNYYMRSTIHPVLSCTIDGLCVAPGDRPDRIVTAAVAKGPSGGKWPKGLVEEVRELGGVGILEMKQTQGKNRHTWTESAPRHFVAQVQTQLFVTGLKWGVVACQLGSYDMIAHVILADKEFADNLSTVCDDFSQQTIF